MSNFSVIKTSSFEEYAMRMVYLAASRSKDPKTKIGAILSINKDIISTGYNGFPRGVFDYQDRYNDRETKYKMVCHAEANSVTTAARNGIKTYGSTCFTNGIPCQECSKILIQAGIQKIVVHKQWPNLIHSEKWVDSIKTSNILLSEAGIEIEVFDKVLNLTGFLDGLEIKV